MSVQIRLRRDTAARWASANPTLASGEMGVETDLEPVRFKIGDGTTAWNDLDYASRSGPALVVAASDASATVRAHADYRCDGVADEVQINAAILASKTVHLSGGTFYIDAPIAGFQNGSTLRGEGIGEIAPSYGTRIVPSASFAGSYAIDVRSSTPSSVSLASVTLRDFLVDGYGSGSPFTDASGIMWGVFRGVIDCVSVYRFKQDGIIVDGGSSPGAWDNFITNSRVEVVGGDGFVFQNEAVDNVVTACHAGYLDGNGVTLGGAGNRFTGCYIEFCGGYGVYASGPVRETGIFGFRIRSTNGGIYWAPDSSGGGLSIVGGTISNPSYDSDNTSDGIVIAPSSAAVVGGIISGISWEMYSAARPRYGINVGSNMTGLVIGPYSSSFLSPAASTFGTAAVFDNGTGTTITTQNRDLAKESFRAYLNSSQTINGSSETVVLFNAEDWDVSGRHDTSTNKGRYTPQVAGYYRISCNIMFQDSLADGVQYYAKIFKNGAGEASGPVVRAGAAAAFYACGATALVKANGSTDYFEVAVWHNDSTGKALQLDRKLTYWCAELVGAS